MTNPSVDLVIQNSSDEDSLANVYFPVIKNKLLEVYGKQIWVQNTTTPGLLNYNIEDLEIIRYHLLNYRRKVCLRFNRNIFIEYIWDIRVMFL